MTASRILSDKGHTVHTVRPDATLLEAAQMLQQHKVGVAVVVDEADAPVGVFSERDLVMSVSIGGESALRQAVSVAMSRSLITAEPHTSIETLMSVMTDRRVRHILIMEGGQLSGIVSIGDVVKRKIALAEAEAESLKAYIEGS